jgi:hypothetical protein
LVLPDRLLAGYGIGTLYEWIVPPEVYEVLLKRRLNKLEATK